MKRNSCQTGNKVGLGKQPVCEELALQNEDLSLDPQHPYKSIPKY